VIKAKPIGCLGEGQNVFGTAAEFILRKNRSEFHE